MFDLSLIHPMIVHFPIALLIVGFISDLFGLILKKDFFSRTGFYLLILGTIGVAAAYFSGRSAGEGLTEAGVLKQALETHEDAAELALWIMVFSALLRIILVLTKKYKGALQYVSILVFFIGVFAIARTGYYGGELVFKHAAGVQFNIGTNFDSGTSETPANQNDPDQKKKDDD